jgi:protein subunit release factor A
VKGSNTSMDSIRVVWIILEIKAGRGGEEEEIHAMIRSQFKAFQFVNYHILRHHLKMLIVL